FYGLVSTASRRRCHCYFFFSSRRRHTRFSRDWSSDVCSSDLLADEPPPGGHSRLAGQAACDLRPQLLVPAIQLVEGRAVVLLARSEERRVGKECRSRRQPWQ